MGLRLNPLLCFPTLPVLSTADYLDQVCSVDQKVEDTILDKGGMRKDKVNSTSLCILFENNFSK